MFKCSRADLALYIILFLFLAPYLENVVHPCSKAMVVICPVRPKKQAITFLEVLHERTIFVRFGSVGNTLTVDCNLVSGSYEYIQVSSPVTMFCTDFIVPNFIYLFILNISLRQFTRASF